MGGGDSRLYFFVTFVVKAPRIWLACPPADAKFLSLNGDDW